MIAKSRHLQRTEETSPTPKASTTFAYLRLPDSPRWQLSGTECHLTVCNRSVAKLVPNFDPRFPKYTWLSVIEYHEYPDHGKHAVDFETLDVAKADIEQWWLHMCQGKRFDPGDQLD